MNKRLTLALFLMTMPFVIVRGADSTLPFSIKITEEKIDKLPDYLGPGNKIDMDFPFGPVEIDGEFWIIYKNGYNGPVLRYKGTNMEDAVRQPDGTATFPLRGPYILGGIWYDKSEKKLYAPIHGEVATYCGNVRREVHLASSTDKGLTWKYEGAILTSPPDLTIKKPATTQSGLYWDGGDGDHVIYVDERGGYIYLFTNHYYWPKLGSPVIPIMEHRVARCAIADKMAPGKWMKFYNGAWSEPGLEGKGSAVNGYVVTYNTYLKKYIAFNGASNIAVCDDLSKQDWISSDNLGPYWCSTGQWAIWPTDDAKRDVSTSGQTFYAYNFWQSSPGRLFKCELGPGTTPVINNSYPTIWSSQIGNYWDTDGLPCYGYQPLFESDDSIMARHTRRVGCESKENTYSGSWSDVAEGRLYEGRAKTASSPGADLTFKFKGKDIYWRAAKGPDLGKADVYLDGTLQGTVDCSGSTGNPLPLAFFKQGLSDEEHTIRIVVKGEKDWAAIKHMFFEYSADTYRASDGFSSVAGKNQWTNQERNGSILTDLTFSDPLWKSGDGCQVGFFQMTPGIGDAVRKWVAPHDGTVRLEGNPALETANPSGLLVSVLKNADSVWSAPLTTMEASPYDTTIEVKTGDTLEFIAHNIAPAAASDPGLEVASKGAVQLNSRDGKPLKIGTKEFTRGVAICADGKIVIHLSEPALHLGATIGLDATADPKANPDYSVAVGNRVLFKPDLAQSKPDGRDLWLDLGGATDITLNVGKGQDWGNAKITQLNDKLIWLADLPLQDNRTPVPRVLWDPVITYVK